MQCPHCQSANPARIIRTERLSSTVYRIKQCRECGELFETSENRPDQCEHCKNSDNNDRVVKTALVDGGQERIRVVECGLCGWRIVTQETMHKEYIKQDTIESV